MKSFFSNLLKDKPQTQQPQQQSQQATQTNAVAAAQPAVAAVQPASSAKRGSVVSPEGVPASPATMAPGASPLSVAPLAAAPAVSSSDRKNARVLLESYVGVIQTVFDHTQPVRAEQDYFVRKVSE